jgi:hypothetical protein
VRCVINPANRGAGIPDGGLFSADQFRGKQRDTDTKENPFLAQNPSRGVIEAKPPSDDLGAIVGTEQRGEKGTDYFFNGSQSHFLRIELGTATHFCLFSLL